MENQGIARPGASPAPPRIVRPWEVSPIKPPMRPVVAMPPPLFPDAPPERLFPDAPPERTLTPPGGAKQNDSGYGSPDFPQLPKDSPAPDSVSRVPPTQNFHASPAKASHARASPTRASPPQARASPDSTARGDTPPSRRARPARKVYSLPPKLTSAMETWYTDHFDHPYPPSDIVAKFAKDGGVTMQQVRKWFSNKRLRTENTLPFNNTMHPRRAQTLQRRREARAAGQAAPYAAPDQTGLDQLRAWYATHRFFPVPLEHELRQLSASTRIEPEQIKKWLKSRWSQDNGGLP